MNIRYRPREIAPRLAEALRRLPVVALSGLRQSGKSTLLTREPAFQSRSYHTLDEFAVLAAAERNPEALLESSGPVTLDEVQRSPGLLLALKTAVDRDRQAGRFLLSESANLALMARVTETLAGRTVYLTLDPMTRREIRGQTSSAPVLVRFLEDRSLPAGRALPVSAEEVLLGGLPPVCLEDPAGADLWFRGYVQTYVERDVRQLAQVSDLIAFRTLTELASLRSAQVLNVSALGRDAKLSAATAGRYLQLLEASFLVRRVPPFLKNRSSRLIKAPKLYFTDSGLAAHLGGVRALDRLANDPSQGALLETYVVQNLCAILEAHRPGTALSYWHEQGRHEVDLVVETEGAVAAIEIKSTSRWSEGDLGGLKTFLERTPQCVAAVMAYNGSLAVRLGPKLWAIPLGHLLA